MSKSKIVSATNSSHSISLGPTILLDIIVSDETIYIYLWIATIVGIVFNQFGIGTNIINIICFVKQGFKDPVTVSFLGLAIADICSLATLLWIYIFFNPAFVAADLPFDAREYQYPTGSVPHVAFARVTAWITAVITLERCLCIAAPLRVKDIVTTKRMCILIIIIFGILLFSVSPMYVVNRLGMKFFPERNKTLIGLLVREDREQVEQVSFIVNNISVPFSAFVVIIVCTTSLAIQLQQKTKWRKESTCSVQTDVVSKRNMKTARLVVIVSGIFIACFFPIVIVFAAMSMEPEISIVGRYRNILTLIGGLGYAAESINSSVNIFVYFHMSTNFRNMFKQIYWNK